MHELDQGPQGSCINRRTTLSFSLGENQNSLHNLSRGFVQRYLTRMGTSK
jgi:hypothetical protein